MTFDLSSMDPNHYDHYILHKPQNVRASEALNKVYILNKIHPASPSIQPFKIGTSTASRSLRSAWHNTIFTLSQSDMVKLPNYQKKTRSCAPPPLVFKFRGRSTMLQQKTGYSWAPASEESCHFRRSMRHIGLR